MDQVFVEGVEFVGRHGVTARERQVGHGCSVDVVLDVDVRHAAQADSLQYTVDYAHVSQIVVTEGTAHSFMLIETLAEHLAVTLLGQLQVSGVEVTVRKLGVAVAGNPSACGVRIRRAAPKNLTREVT
jgi:dihydroneopterin aldolase